MNKGKLSLIVILLTLVTLSIVPTIYITANVTLDQTQTINKESINKMEPQDIGEKIAIFYKYVFTPVIIMLGIIGILLPTIEILNRTNKL